jgi:hypothetical protein
MAGLRRNEIDKLPWTAFRFDEGVIHIQTTEYFRPKSRESENDVPVDPVLALGAPPSGRLGWGSTIAERASKARGGPPGAKILYSIGEKLFGRLRAPRFFHFKVSI